MARFKEQLKERLELSPSSAGQLPSGYQRIGDFAILQLRGLEEYEKDIGKVVKELLGVKAVFSRNGVSGDFRTPRIKRIAGSGSVTIHKENGCLFRVDVTKVMFSQGNSFERGRVVASDGEDVVDMFAGIGYFSIGIAKRTPSCSIMAVEKNPEAAKLLKDNVKLNKLNNVEIVEGDCRELERDNCADRVIMGYFPRTEAFLDKAFLLLRLSGVIHFHNIYRRGELWRIPLGTLETSALDNGYKMDELIYKNVIKSYSPGKEHVVVDCKFVRNR